MRDPSQTKLCNRRATINEHGSQAMHLASGSSCTSAAGSEQVPLPSRPVPEAVPLCRTILLPPRAEWTPALPLQSATRMVLQPIIIRNTEVKNRDFQFDTMHRGKPIE